MHGRLDDSCRCLFFGTSRFHKRSCRYGQCASTLPVAHFRNATHSRGPCRHPRVCCGNQDRQCGTKERGYHTNKLYTCFPRRHNSSQPLGGRALCPLAAYLPGQCREMAHSHNVSSRPRAVCRTASLALFHQAGEVCLEVLGGNVLGVGDMWRGRESGRRGARGRKGRAVP